MNTADNRTINLLNEVYKSTKIAADAINVLLSKTQSAEFKNVLKQQYNKYQNIANAAANELYGYRLLPPENDFITKAGMWSAVSLATITNQTSGHMAEILINGSTLGIIEITRLVNSNVNVSPSARNIADQLIETDRNNINIMQNYLA